MPKASAFDLLDQISRKMPPAAPRSSSSDTKSPDAGATTTSSTSVPSEGIKLDVAELEIRPKKGFIKGTVDTAAAVDEIAAKLKTIDCVEDVSKGAITEVTGGAKQFTLTIGAKCP